MLPTWEILVSEQLLNIRQCFRLLNISRSTFHLLRRRDPSFPAPNYVCGPTSPRWHRADVVAWIKRGTDATHVA